MLTKWVSSPWPGFLQVRAQADIPRKCPRTPTELTAKSTCWQAPHRTFQFHTSPTLTAINPGTAKGGQVAGGPSRA